MGKNGLGTRLDRWKEFCSLTTQKIQCTCMPNFTETKNLAMAVRPLHLVLLAEPMLLATNAAEGWDRGHTRNLSFKTHFSFICRYTLASKHCKCVHKADL